MIEIRSMESLECLGDICVQSAVLGTVKTYTNSCYRKRV